MKESHGYTNGRFSILSNNLKETVTAEISTAEWDDPDPSDEMATWHSYHFTGYT